MGESAGDSGLVVEVTVLMVSVLFFLLTLDLREENDLRLTDSFDGLGGIPSA